MPRVNVYIREEDKAAWDALPNKSEWLRERLTCGSYNITTGKDGVVKPADPTKPSRYTTEPIEFCKHSAVKGMCKKGCK